MILTWHATMVRQLNSIHVSIILLLLSSDNLQSAECKPFLGLTPRSFTDLRHTSSSHSSRYSRKIGSFSRRTVLDNRCPLGNFSILQSVLSSFRCGASIPDIAIDSDQESSDALDLDDKFSILVEEEEDESEDTDEEDETDGTSNVDAKEDLQNGASHQDEDIDEEKGEEIDSKSSTSLGPIKLTIKTGLNSPLVDQIWESTCSRTRTVLSVKQNLSRQMKGRPPVSTQRLLLNGFQELSDDTLLGDVVQEDDDDEEEDDDENENSDGMVKLQLTLDIPPPVDAKFATEYPELLSKMTKQDLIDAYAANMAAMNYVADSLVTAAEATMDAQQKSQDEDESSANNEASGEETMPPAQEHATLIMRKMALIIKEQLLSTMPGEVKQVIETDTRTQLEEENESLEAESQRKLGIQGGASMNVKRMMQHNLNINWSDTIRNALLFLFFGYFGARDNLSRACMLCAAPLCFILQARPAKIVMKQIFYAIGKPPAIFLSLLPAPQQAIMDLDMSQAMKELYGPNYGKREGAATQSAVEMTDEEPEMSSEPEILNDEDEGLSEFLESASNEDVASDYS